MRLNAGSIIELNLILIIFASIFFQGAVADIYWYPVGLWIIIIFCISLFNREKGRGSSSKLAGLEPYLFAWLALMILSGILSSHRWASLLSLQRLITSVIFFYLVLRHFQDRKKERALVWSLFAIPVVLSLIGIISYLTKAPLFFPFPDNREFVSATFINPNNFAGLINLCLFFGFGIVIGSRRKRDLSSEDRARRALMAFPLFILFVALGFSLSRGAWISFVLAGIGFLFWLGFSSRRKRFRNYLLVILAIFILGIGLTLQMEKGAIISEAKTLERFFTEPQSGLTLTTRAKVWESSLFMIRDHPLVGAGPGTYWIEYPRYRGGGVLRGVRHAHNDFLELAVEGGLISATAFLALLIKAFHLWRKRYNEEMDRFERRVSVGIAFGMLGFFLQDQLAFHFHIPGLVYYFLALTAFLLRPGRG